MPLSGYGGCGCASLSRVRLSSDDVRELSWSHFPALESLQLDCPGLVRGGGKGQEVGALG